MKKILESKFILVVTVVLLTLVTQVFANSIIQSNVVSYTNSKTNETTVTGALDELFSAVDINEEIAVIKEEISDLKDDSKLMNKIYPIGSIYISTSNVNPKTLFDGTTWERYGVGKTLLSTDGISGQTGGSNTVTLNTNNLPSHSHSYTPTGSVKSTFTGTSSTTNQVDLNHTHSVVGTTGYQSVNHTHSIPALSGSTNQASLTGSVHAAANIAVNCNQAPYFSNATGIFSVSAYTDTQYFYTGGTYATFASNRQLNINASHSHTVTTTASTTGSNSTSHYHDVAITSGYMSANNKHSHTVTPLGSVSSSFTGTKTSTENTGSGASFSVQNPYITVYMWKRIS